MKNDNHQTFHLGITMAGAVSAGCYTAGVIDYLFETLDLWERAKKGVLPEIPDKLIPKHSVVIDAMGGTSAGGMATIMTAIYALQGNINPVKKVPTDPKKSYNVLYDSWIHLDDDEDKLTFEKLWETDDLDKGTLQSILNSSILENIANRAFNNIDDNLDYQKHVSENLPDFILLRYRIYCSHPFWRNIWYSSTV